MSESRANFIDFQGILLQKSRPSAEGLVTMVYLTQKGQRTIVACNPLLLPSMQLGVTYYIKGHELTGYGTTYIRLMSARARLEPELAIAQHGRKIISGSVSLAVLVALTVGAIVSSPGQVKIEDTKTHTNTTSQPVTGLLQESARDLAAVVPAHQAEILPDPVTAAELDHTTPSESQISTEFPMLLPVFGDEKVSSASTVDTFSISVGELSSSNATTTDFQPSHGLQVPDVTLRPTLEAAPESNSEPFHSQSL